MVRKSRNHEGSRFCQHRVVVIGHRGGQHGLAAVYGDQVGPRHKVFADGCRFVVIDIEVGGAAQRPAGRGVRNGEEPVEQQRSTPPRTMLLAPR